MPHILHILNGDSTLQLFKKTSLIGETVVWREVLAEGPVHLEFNSRAFWKEREEFMNQFSSSSEYNEKVYEPFQKIEGKRDQFDEIVLWFEFDLFCQINMLALIHWLNQKRIPGQTISLVCSGKMDDSDKLYGLGELKPEQLELLYNNRLKLNTREFTFASDFYKTYCSENAEDLYTYIIMPSDEFIYISDALNAHLRRFPYLGTGLNEIEQKILELISEGINDHKKLVGKLLQWQTYYGFGDLQYLKMLESLKPLFEDYDTLQLKTEPELRSAIKSLNRNTRLGGASLSQWCYDPDIRELVKLDIDI